MDDSTPDIDIPGIEGALEEIVEEQAVAAPAIGGTEAPNAEPVDAPAPGEWTAPSEPQQTDEDFTATVLPAAERIRDCLDLSALPGELRDAIGIESSVYMKEVLDRIQLPATRADARRYVGCSILQRPT